MKVIAVVLTAVLLDCSTAFIENCHVDNSICTNSSPPKLKVEYANPVLCNQILQIIDVAQPPKISFSQGKEGNKYVLVFSDPDAPFPCAYSDGSRYLHYAAMVTLANGDLVATQQLVGYRGPHPPAGTHRYQFHLYPWSQSGLPVMHNTATSRGHFKLEVFERDNKLSPAAVFQIRVPH